MSLGVPGAGPKSLLKRNNSYPAGNLKTKARPVRCLIAVATESSGNLKTSLCDVPSLLNMSATPQNDCVKE